jgi:hypothetical protein
VCVCCVFIIRCTSWCVTVWATRAVDDWTVSANNLYFCTSIMSAMYLSIHISTVYLHTYFEKIRLAENGSARCSHQRDVSKISVIVLVACIDYRLVWPWTVVASSTCTTLHGSPVIPAFLRTHVNLTIFSCRTHTHVHVNIYALLKHCTHTLRDEFVRHAHIHTHPTLHEPICCCRITCCHLQIHTHSEEFPSDTGVSVVSVNCTWNEYQASTLHNVP